ncbi:hypothetical protein CR513_33276, partial [Mucuna pruriens]
MLTPASRLCLRMPTLSMLTESSCLYQIRPNNKTDSTLAILGVQSVEWMQDQGLGSNRFLERTDPFRAHSGGLTALYMAIFGGTLQLCHGGRRSCMVGIDHTRFGTNQLYRVVPDIWELVVGHTIARMMKDQDKMEGWKNDLIGKGEQRHEEEPHNERTRRNYHSPYCLYMEEHKRALINPFKCHIPPFDVKDVETYLD